MLLGPQYLLGRMYDKCVDKYTHDGRVSQRKVMYAYRLVPTRVSLASFT